MNIPFEDRWRTAPMARFSVGECLDLIYLLQTRTAHIVPTHDVDIAGCCSFFKTIHGHADRLAVDRSAVAEFAQYLQGLAQAGLLISRSQLNGPKDVGDSNVEDARITWIAIPTRDRPVELHRAIDSYISSAIVSGRKPRLFVADDSIESAESSAVTLDTLGQVVESHGIEVVYAGRAEKIAFARHLVSGGDLPWDTVQFALFGDGESMPSTGANRNSILIRTSGSLCLSVDDDTICRTGTVPDAYHLGTLTIASEGDPSELWFFADRESAFEFVDLRSVDLIAEHERYLGKSVSQLLRTAETSGVEVDFARACAHILHGACTGEARVALTTNGSLGDCGMYSPSSVAAGTSGATRQRIVASQDAYALSKHTREVVRQVVSPTISHARPFMGMVFGLDNREITAPFCPIFRNQDGLFGLMTARVNPDAYHSHIPWFIVHDPPKPLREYTAGGADIRVADVLIALVQTWSGVNHGDPGQRLQSLGRHLEDLSSQSEADFIEHLQIRLWANLASEITYQEKILSMSGGRPEFWADDLNARMRELRINATSDYWKPVEVRSRGEAAAPYLQKLVKEFGRLLYWWPAIIERTRQLASQGIELGRRIS